MIETVSVVNSIKDLHFLCYMYIVGVKSSAVVSKPIPLKDFAAYVAEMHKNDDNGFEIEYGVRFYTVK